MELYPVTLTLDFLYDISPWPLLNVWSRLGLFFSQQDGTSVGEFRDVWRRIESAVGINSTLESLASPLITKP